MNIRDLEYVLALVDKRHFGRAAQACHVSQPALSTQIKKLEQSLGFSLFERKQNDVVPLEKAQIIIESARIIVEKVALIKRHAQFVTQDVKIQILNLGVIPTIAPYYLPAFFRDINVKGNSEQLRWQIVEEKTETLIERLNQKRLDAAIMVVPHEGITQPHRELFSEPLYLAVARGHELAKRKQIAPADIAEEDWLLLDDGHCLNIPIFDICTRAHHSLQQHSFRASSLETLRHMVASRSGVTLMPDMARKKDDGIVYIPLKDAKRYHRRVSIVWREDSLGIDAIKGLVKRLSYRDGT